MSTISEEMAEALDADDPLAAFRNEFYLPENTIYLDGNSLGLLSRAGEAAVLRVLDGWKRLGVSGWTEADPPWFFLAEELGRQMAELIGAAADETIAANSTTVNLHQLLSTLLAEPDGRNTILVDRYAFPSDAYAIDSFIRLQNLAGRTPLLRCVRAPGEDGALLDEDAIVAGMTPDVRLTLMPAVVYTTGQLLNMERIATEARRRNILVGFDCSHSIGCVPHQFDAWGVDFAFWCGYKYLNGGPGAAGGLYLNRRHFGSSPGLAGWFSSIKERQLEMLPELHAAATAGALQIGTPNILSMAPLCGTIRMIQAAGLDRIRSKSIRMTAHLIRLADARLAEYGVRVVSPREDARRGGHVALAHPQAIRICKALRAEGVVPDYRPPDIIRLAPVALYNTYMDCWNAIEVIRVILLTRKHMAHSADRPVVS